MLLISTPCYGGMCVKEFASSLLSLRGVVPFAFDAIVNESLISRARCMAVANFMNNDRCDRMLFIDSDIGFSCEDVRRISEVDTDVCIVPYPKKWVFWDKADGETDPEEARKKSASLAINRGCDGSVRDGATGFMMIKKDVIKKMQEAYPELKVRNDHENAKLPHYWVLFDTMVEKGPPGFPNRYLSEDYAFCRRWQAIGGRVRILEPVPSLGHVGNITFSGQFGLRE